MENKVVLNPCPLSLTLQGRYSIKSTQRVKWFSLSLVIRLWNFHWVSFSQCPACTTWCPRSAKVSMALPLCTGMPCPSCTDLLLRQREPVQKSQMLQTGGPSCLHSLTPSWRREKWCLPEERQWRELLSQRCFSGALPSLPSVCLPPHPSTEVLYGWIFSALNWLRVASSQLLFACIFIYLLHHHSVHRVYWVEDIQRSSEADRISLTLSLKFFLFLIEGKLLSNVVLLSAMRQCKPIIRILLKHDLEAAALKLPLLIL